MAFSLLLSVVFALYVAKRVWVVVQANKNDERFRRQYTTIMPLSIVGSLLPTTWWNLGLKFIWRDKYSLYLDVELKTKLIVPLLYGTELLYSTNLATFRQLLGNNSSFLKPEASYTDLQFMGVNVVASEGEVWKRHRRIVAPAFNYTTYQNVWSTTASVYHSMVEKEGWATVQEARVADTNLITHKLALFVVSIVGFGIPMSWDMADRDEGGCLTIQGMVFRVSQSILMRSRTPKWAYNLGIKGVSECDEAYTAFEKFMVERIAAREDDLRKLQSLEEVDGDVNEGIRDVFGRLVNARLSDGKLALTDSEIIGNCFILVFAGHETTAYTLSATLALLALFPEAQEWVYTSIEKVLGSRDPTFDDFDDLDDVLACFYETLRMFPAAYLMIREAHSDTILRLPRTDNPDLVEEVPVKKGTNVVMDFVGIGYDSQTFPDPESFQPWRWSKTKTEDGESTANAREASEVSSSNAATALEGFTGFSFGPRTCLGHKFAKIEAVAFLTHLIKDWRIEPDLRNDETTQDWKKRALEPGFGITMTFEKIPVKLERRK